MELSLLVSLILIFIVFCVTVIALVGMVMGSPDIARNAVDSLGRLGQNLIATLSEKVKLLKSTERQK